jgi:hypothetical protein
VKTNIKSRVPSATVNYYTANPLVADINPPVEIVRDWLNVRKAWDGVLLKVSPEHNQYTRSIRDHTNTMDEGAETVFLDTFSSSNGPTANVAKSQLETTIARLLTEEFSSSDPSTEIVNAERLQFFARGAKAAFQALAALPDPPTVNKRRNRRNSDSDPQRKIDPNTLEGRLMDKEGILSIVAD